MADSFAIQLPQVAGVSTNVQAPSIQAGVVGGGPSGGVQAAPLPVGDDPSRLSNPAFTALMQIGGKIAQERWNETLDAQALDGAMRAMQGESAKSIAAQNPLGRIFGDSAAVASARVVEAQSAATALNTEILEGMDEIQRMSPDEFRGWYSGKLNGVRTGDTNTDVIIAQQALKQMPATLDMQMRAHYQFTQDEAGRAWVSGAVQQAGLYEKAASAAGVRTGEDSPGMSAEAFAGVQVQTAAMLQGPSGLSEQNYRKYLSSVYTSLVETRNWETVKMLDESGTLDAALPADAVKQLRNARDLEGAKANTDDDRITSYMVNAEVHEAKTNAAAYESVEQVVEGARAVNSVVLQKTGNPVPFYSEKAIAGLVSNHLAAHARLGEQVRQVHQKQSMEQADTVAQQIAVEQAWATGYRRPLDGAPINASVLAKMEQQQFNNATASPEKWGQFVQRVAINSVDGYVHPDFKRFLVSNLRPTLTNGALIGKNGEGTKKALETVQQLLSMPQGAGALSLTLGADQAADVTAMLQWAGDLSDPTALSNLAKDARAGKVRSPTDAEVKGVREYLNTQDATWWGGGGMLKNYDLSDTRKADVARSIAPVVARLGARNPGLVGPDKLVGMALAEYLKNRDFIGDVFVEKNQVVPGDKTMLGAVQATMKDAVLDQKRYNDLLRVAVQQQVKKLDTFERLGEDYVVDSVMDMGGYGKDKRYSVTVSPEGDTYNGTPLSVVISAAEIAKLYLNYNGPGVQPKQVGPRVIKQDGKEVLNPSAPLIDFGQ